MLLFICDLWLFLLPRSKFNRPGIMFRQSPLTWSDWTTINFKYCASQIVIYREFMVLTCSGVLNGIKRTPYLMICEHFIFNFYLFFPGMSASISRMQSAVFRRCCGYCNYHLVRPTGNVAARHASQIRRPPRKKTKSDATRVSELGIRVSLKSRGLFQYEDVVLSA